VVLFAICEMMLWQDPYLVRLISDLQRDQVRPTEKRWCVVGAYGFKLSLLNTSAAA
jgi:hypothetical protein